jgi:hypothetical protein
VTFLTTFARVLESATVCFHFPLQLFPAKKCAVSLIKFITSVANRQSNGNNIRNDPPNDSVAENLDSSRKYEFGISVGMVVIFNSFHRPKYGWFVDCLYCIVLYDCFLRYRLGDRTTTYRGNGVTDRLIHSARYVE